MITITKERLLTIKQWRETYGPDSNVVLPAEEAEELARIALASLEAEPIGAFHIAEQQVDGTSDYIKDGEWPIDNGIIEVYAAPPVPVVPAALPENDDEDGHDIDYLEPSEVYALGRTAGWNACRAAMLQSGNFRENKNSSTNNFREIAETSTNYPVIPSEVLSAILKVAKIRADFDDFDGDRRGIGDCLDEAEQELIVTINKYASQLAAEPIATNDVREQTAVPPVPVIQADVAQAIEKLKWKLVECNRYNYCADAVKGVEYACHAAMLQGSQPVSQSKTYRLDFGQWLEQQRGKIDVDCGCVSTETFMHWLWVAYEAGNYPDIPDSSVPAPGKGVTGERIRIKPHVYRELVNRLHDTAIKCAGTQQLRERISRVLGDVITPDHHKQAEKSDLERCHLEAALNIKPGHTLGIIDALLVHKMARALLPLVAEKHEVDHANES